MYRVLKVTSGQGEGGGFLYIDGWVLGGDQDRKTEVEIGVIGEMQSDKRLLYTVVQCVPNH